MLGQSQKVMEFLGFFEKKALRSWEMAIECSWNGWHDVSKIFWAAGMASVTTTMFVMSLIWTAWLIPHLMVKSSASVDEMFMV